jgi:PAS domain S-box-containing protein
MNINKSRKDHKYIHITGLILLFLCLAYPGLEAGEKVKVGIFDFEPLCRTGSTLSGEKDKSEGLFVEILQYIASKEGWNIEYIPGTLGQCMDRLEKGAVDLMVAAAYSEINEKRFDFTMETVISTWAQVYTLDQGKIKSLIQLDSRSVGVVRDDPYNQALREIVKGFNINCTFVEFNHSGEVFHALREQWIDAGLVDRLYGVLHEREYNVKRTPIIFSPVELRFAAARGQNRHIIDTLDYHLNLLKKDTGSIYYQLANRTLGIRKDAGIPKLLVWILGIMFGLLVLFISMNYILRREVESRTQALRESEEKFRIISEQSLMAVAIIQDEVIKYANQAFSDLSEYPMEEVMNWKPLEYAKLLHPDDRDFVLEQSRKKQQGDTDVVHHYTYRFFAKSGKMRWVEHYSRSILFKGKYASLMTVVDITGQKEAGEKLAAEKERLTVTLASIGDGVITTDKQGNVVLVNRAAESITGWDQEEAAGKPIDEIFQVTDERTGNPRRNPVHEVMKSGTIMEYTNGSILKARDGTEQIIMSSCAPIRDTNNRVVGSVLVFRDVTEKRKMEQELQRTQKIESIGLMAGGIAHDFNNLLAIVTGNIGLAKLSMQPKQKSFKLLEAAEKGAFNAIGLSQQLLTFSKGGDPVKQTASIREIIEDSVNFALRGSACRCDCSFPDRVLPVEVDKGQISQVLQNLIINADQAMPCGGIIHIHVENLDNGHQYLHSLRQQEYIKISIRDQGVGIQKEHLDKIFDPFFTTKQKGNGLGLSIVYSIIKKHDGMITAASEPGKGTDFHIYLPASEGKVNQMDERQNITEGEGKILVMDDNEDIRVLLGAILDRIGYNAVFAGHGDEAVSIYREDLRSGRIIDAVILDLTISGGMGGKETIRKLQEIDPHVKALVASGYSNDPVIANYSNFGFKGVINKPFKIEQLSRVLHEVISKPIGVEASAP